MRADPRERILEDLSEEETDQLLTDLDAEELLELAESLPPRLVELALARMDSQQREWFHGAHCILICVRIIGRLAELIGYIVRTKEGGYVRKCFILRSSDLDGRAQISHSRKGKRRGLARLSEAYYTAIQVN